MPAKFQNSWKIESTSNVKYNCSYLQITIYYLQYQELQYYCKIVGH